jgi:hypothetical protein
MDMIQTDLEAPLIVHSSELKVEKHDKHLTFEMPETKETTKSMDSYLRNSTAAVSASLLAVILTLIIFMLIHCARTNATNQFHGGSLPTSNNVVSDDYLYMDNFMLEFSQYVDDNSDAAGFNKIQGEPPYIDRTNVNDDYWRLIDDVDIEWNKLKLNVDDNSDAAGFNKIQGEPPYIDRNNVNDGISWLGWDDDDIEWNKLKLNVDAASNNV